MSTHQRRTIPPVPSPPSAGERARVRGRLETRGPLIRPSATFSPADGGEGTASAPFLARETRT